MTFNAAFIAHVPDADPERDVALLETDYYRLFSVLVRDTDQAVTVCQRLVADEGVDSILLCPGNSHEDVSRIVADGSLLDRNRMCGEAGKGRIASRGPVEAYHADPHRRRCYAVEE